MVYARSQNHNLEPKSNIRYRSYKFSLSIIGFIQGLPEKKIYWTISDQLLRSATSIGANITEARGASSKRDFARFYEIALKSTNETLYWLSLMKDSRLVLENKIDSLIEEAKEISNMLAASILTMKNKRF